MCARLFVAGDFTTRLLASYEPTPSSCADGGLVRALTQANPALSCSEAVELLKAAAAVTSSQTDGERGCVSWGVFCTCCTELVAREHNQAQSHTKRHRERISRRKHTTDSSSVVHSHKYDVFLGGSCNPTCWRRDVVIPRLLKEGITYYNPQVESWFPELIEVEEQAKQAASQLLYVIDNQTRAVASMVEVADYVGSGRDVLVVVDNITGEAPSVGGDRLSQREVEDLNRGRAFVRMVTAAGGCLLEATIHSAVCALVDLSRWGQCSEEEDSSSRPEQPESLVTHLTTRLRLLGHVHTMYDSERRGYLSVEEVEMALQSLECDVRVVGTIWKRISETSDWLLWKHNGISLEVFRILYAEARHQSLLLASSEEGIEGGRKGLLTATAGYVRGGLQRLAGWLWSSSSLTTPPDPPHTHYDVYLGGSCGATSWRHDDIIPILRQHEVTYFDPQVSHWESTLIPVEQTAKDQCSVLLFVIGGDTLSVASMVEVAYHIGQGRRLVLALSHVPLPQDSNGYTDLEDIRLSTRAVRDYNRGRAYLGNIARKNSVPLYTDLVEAAVCAVCIVKGYNVPSHSVDANIPLLGTSV